MVTDWLPEEFLEEMRDILGSEYEQYLDSFERPAVRGLRVNTLKWTREACMEKLPCRTEKVPWIPNGLFCDGDVRLSKDPYYYGGLYYLQEPSAMTPASLLPVEPGDMVLDLCAAPGGKSTELGARLLGRGMLVANDISHSRAKALLKNIELSGIANACVVSEPPERLARVFGGFFHKILVDAPCSGEGMFRKDRDMVKDWKDRGPGYYSSLQREIAGEAVGMLREGGCLLYSTCTFSREEDEEVVQWLLDRFPDMELVPLPRFEGACGGIGLEGCIRLFPHKIRGEGHFMALLRKGEGRKGRAGESPRGCPLSGNAAMSEGCRGQETRAEHGEGGREEEAERPEGYRKLERAGKSKKYGNLARDRKPENYGKPENHGRGEKNRAGKQKLGAGTDDGRDLSRETELTDFLRETKIRWDYSRMVKKQDRIYYLPEGFAEGTGLRFLRTGLWMGDLKNGRFEPSQAMAMVLGETLYSNCVSFDREDGRVIRYLKGETITLEEDEGPAYGWCLVCVDGFALGFGKGNGMTIKNKYYAGWRWQ